MFTLENLQQIIKDNIEELNFNQSPKELYDPINYILDLGGKRLRPALCLLACDMFDGEIQQALNPALGIEIFHNFTLLHDDIMDEAPIRRGKQTVHLKWNPNVAILSGDTMMALAYEYVMKAPKEVLQEVFSVFNQTAIEVCEGQQYDMNFETDKKVSISDYLNMIRLKTAVLLAGSLKIGALIGKANKKDAENLYLFGENLGIAFQLKDDLLDAYSDEEKFGKKTGGDIVTNKKTFLYLKAFELADGKTKESLADYFNGDFADPVQKIIGVKEIFQKIEVDIATNKEIDNYYQRALSYLDKVNTTQDKKSELLKFADQLKQRDY
ncbi:MAG: polyprenyl synthetase family protein [Deltaproteobacteria bacterium]|nr:MAG: polyprenyl synthetase family protein [Deltaproteobacteria bacterium]